MNNKSNIFNRSLQAKVVLAVGLCLSFVGGSIIGYSAITSQAMVIKNAKEITIGKANFEASKIDAELEIAMDTARTLAQSFASVKNPANTEKLTRGQVNAMLIEVLEKNPHFLGVYTAWEPNAFDGNDAEFSNTDGTDESGRLIPYWVRGADGSILLDPLVDYEVEGAGEYYLCSKRTKQECLIDPYLYEIEGNMVLLTSTVVPIIYNGEFFGIAGIDIQLNFLQEMVDKIDLYNNTAKLVIISNNGTIAAVSDEAEFVGKPLAEMQADYEEDIAKIQSGLQDVSEEGSNIQTLAPILVGNTKTPWAAQLYVPKTEVTREATQQANISIAISIGLIILGLVIVWFLIGRLAIQPLAIMAGALRNMQSGDLNRDIPQSVKDAIVKRDDELGIAGKGLASVEIYLIQMAEDAKRIAIGDLTSVIEPKSEKDELGHAFVAMIAGLREAVGQINESASNLAGASGQLASAANQAGQATNQINVTVQQVAKGTADQAASVNLTASSVDQMGKAIDGVAKGAQEQSQAIARASEVTAQINSAIQQVASNAAAVTRDSAAAANAARSGTATVEETLQGMQSIKAKVGASAEKVEEMGRRSQEIGAIVETIEDIASQTNLLALNAAIEAARAGEHGKGFAVVADEVRKLAERSSSATKEIGELIRGIQKTVADAVKAMEEGSKEVEGGVLSANKAGAALEDILKAAEAVNLQAIQAGEAAGQMNASAEELVSAVDTVSAVVEENTAATEEMAANSTEVTQAIESIASVSEENSAAIEEVSASTEEMSAQVEEVTASAASLAELAQQLQAVVNRFKLK
jgi:methyl-accepting chemotaxis protein